MLKPLADDYEELKTEITQVLKHIETHGDEEEVKIPILNYLSLLRFKEHVYKKMG